MKHQNDVRGLKAGDEYIKEGCQIICDIFDHSPVFRVGGDEFEVLAMDYSENSILKFISRMNAYLDNINKGAGKPYNVYASCGYSICCINPGMNLNEWMTLSDNRMYEEKEKMRGVRKIIKD